MTLESLQPGGLYHLYNHAVGNENLFLSDDNYCYFLRRYHFFVDPVADTYVYCLMPNHLHFFIEVKRNFDLPKNSGKDIGAYVSKRFANLFSSYAQAFNKQQGRQGALFRERFRRQPIDSDEYITRLIRYIHLNPEHHGFVKDFSEWKYSSYRELCSGLPTKLARDKVVNWFGNLDEFKKAHLGWDQAGFRVPIEYRAS